MSTENIQKWDTTIVYSENQLKKVYKSINQHIEKANIIIFGKSYCHYTKNAIEILQKTITTIKGKDERKSKNNLNIKIVYLDTLPGDSSHDYLVVLHDQTHIQTVPQIFMLQYFIGNCENIQELDHSGDLQEMLLVIQQQSPQSSFKSKPKKK